MVVTYTRASTDIYRSEEELDAAALAKEILIPIRIDIDTDTHRIRDCFVWNLNGKPVSIGCFINLYLRNLTNDSLTSIQKPSSVRLNSLESSATTSSYLNILT